jgi:tetratricopeptide (TPR) repeat protein
VIGDREAIAIDGNNAFAHASLGISLDMMGLRGDAIAELNEALRIDPNLSIARRELEKLNFVQPVGTQK